MAFKLVDANARLLYEYMKTQAQMVSGKPGESELLLCITIDGAWDQHRPTIDQLHKAGWLKKHANPNLLILGHAVIVKKFYGTDLGVSEHIELLYSRYSDREKTIIGMALSREAEKKGKSKLTKFQELDELDFYSRYSVNTVIECLKTFLNLNSSYGLPYARGIIRNYSPTHSFNPIPVLSKEANSTKTVVSLTLDQKKSRWLSEKLKHQPSQEEYREFKEQWENFTEEEKEKAFLDLGVDQ